MKRVHTGAYMASAMQGRLPNRKGPFESARHSFQIDSTRATSASAPAHTLNPGKWPLMFIGKAERRLLKPECISPQIERQRARAARFFGSSPAPGFTSLRYSAIASGSQTLTAPWVRHGTRNEGDSSNYSARMVGSSLMSICSSKSRLAILHNNQPRSDQEP